MPLLIRAILKETSLPRLRLSSIEPEALSPALLDLWSDPRLCRHLHLPLQSGCDATLKRMGRRYRSAEFAVLVEQARRVAPDVAVTTDVIAGFPGETDSEFAQSLSFAKEMQFGKIHVFRYSARRNTPAVRLPHTVPEAIKKQRSNDLLALSAAAESAFRRRFIGETHEVLWEERISRGTRHIWSGLTGNYLRAYAESGINLRNVITRVVLLREEADGLWTEVLPVDGT